MKNKVILFILYLSSLRASNFDEVLANTLTTHQDIFNSWWYKEEKKGFIDTRIDLELKESPQCSDIR